LLLHDDMPDPKNTDWQLLFHPDCFTKETIPHHITNNIQYYSCIACGCPISPAFSMVWPKCTARVTP
jgi:hypothetical protein